ncbi:GTP cyclohydrolase I FolE2 [Patescibacteria group bacterium]|nr:GTP cyclohydrolase I FolE2 [Patescibacteria group bacterium]MBU1706043.1 GTP cyclohydrolase I FolE2 [Patescibacteria group bacterium]MBU1870920.1 GTP cyclohydrolase I FolE2 [Patescibacteria group bacterium]
MKDIQKNKPVREIDINMVGVKNLKAPLVVIDKKNKCQETVGSINIFVNLPRHYRGTHISRFIEVLNRYTKKTLTVEVLDKLTLEILRILEAEKSRIEIEFPYFILKSSPISKKKSLLDYQCKIIRIANRNIKEIEHIIQVEVPITTVCPCSKAISKYGAHNQRGYVTVSMKLNKFFWIEEVIDIIEEEASCDIYPLLKREDEKYVTEKAYENPKFAEDIVRDVSYRLEQDKRIDWFKVECENQESVHNHNVYAKIENRLPD